VLRFPSRREGEHALGGEVREVLERVVENEGGRLQDVDEMGIIPVLASVPSLLSSASSLDPTFHLINRE
jgi:hypothetical protein